MLGAWQTAEDLRFKVMHRLTKTKGSKQENNSNIYIYIYIYRSTSTSTWTMVHPNWPHPDHESWWWLMHISKKINKRRERERERHYDGLGYFLWILNVYMLCMLRRESKENLSFDCFFSRRIWKWLMSWCLIIPMKWNHVMGVNLN